MIVKARKVNIHHPVDLLGHVDGEPVHLGQDVEVEILPLSLKVAVPPGHLKQTQNIFSPIMEMLPKITIN